MLRTARIDELADSNEPAKNCHRPTLTPQSEINNVLTGCRSIYPKA